jgi:hypothetical protein
MKLSFFYAFQFTTNKIVKHLKMDYGFHFTHCLGIPLTVFPVRYAEQVLSNRLLVLLWAGLSIPAQISLQVQ